MKVKIERSEMYGEINAAPSKSFLHRAFIAAALSDKPTVISHLTMSDDVTATVKALEAFGAKFKIESGTARVTPIKKLAKSAKVMCGESGTSLRLLLPLAGALGIETTFDGGAKLASRPIEGLMRVMEQRGIVFSAHKLPVTITKALKPGEYEIGEAATSQYVSGLLMALPLLDGDSTIVYDRTKTSHGYIDITVEVMRSFGVNVERTEEGYSVKGGQKYKSAGVYKVEGDWSSAANWLVAGALAGEVRVSGLNPESCQSDRAIIDILKKAGADVAILKDKIHVKKSALKSVEFDGNEFLDIIPIASVACALADGTSEFTNIERLKYKESNRLESVVTMLDCLEIKNKYTSDGIKIKGGAFIDALEITLPADHRLVMALSVAGLTMGSLVINNAEAVTKSYPDYFEDLKELGGRVTCL